MLNCYKKKDIKHCYICAHYKKIQINDSENGTSFSQGLAFLFPTNTLPLIIKTIFQKLGFFVCVEV